MLAGMVFFISPGGTVSSVCYIDLAGILLEDEGALHCFYLWLSYYGCWKDLPDSTKAYRRIHRYTIPKHSYVTFAWVTPTSTPQRLHVAFDWVASTAAAELPRVIFCFASQDHGGVTVGLKWWLIRGFAAKLPASLQCPFMARIGKLIVNSPGVFRVLRYRPWTRGRASRWMLVSKFSTSFWALFVLL